MAAHAAVALHNARLSERLLSSERHETRSRMAVAIAHDIGKELDWMSRLVNRLPKQLGDRAKSERDIAMVQEFTDGLVQRIRRFVRDATESSSEPPGTRPLGEQLASGIQRMSRIHGEDRVSCCIDPAVRDLHEHENLGRAVANLLDNALHATPEPDPVQLFATRESSWVRVEVVDSGPGIPDEMKERVFDLGFSTRLDSGGSGVGLTIAREIVIALGGTIELANATGGGTRATVRVPAMSEETTCDG
jgi:signal transduction histidine kinase